MAGPKSGPGADVKASSLNAQHRPMAASDGTR